MSSSPLFNSKQSRVVEFATLVLSVTLLVAATALATFLIHTYREPITYILKKVQVTPGPLLALALVAGVALYSHKTRGVGYSLGTVVLAAVIMALYFFRHEWPDHPMSLLGWKMKTDTALYLGVGLGLAWVSLQIAEQCKWLSEITAAVEAKAEAEQALVIAKSDIAISRSNVSSTEKRNKELVAIAEENKKARISDAEKAAVRYKRQAQHRLYEAQYVGGFLMAVGFRIAQVGERRPFAINYLQGGKDRELADLVSAVAGRFWLIEFKRSDAVLKDEFTKTTRERQIKELKKHPHIIALADKCHFIGWGVVGGEMLSISRYLDLWSDLEKMKDSPLMSADDFLIHAIPEQPKVAEVGIPADQFQLYLRFLEHHGGCATGDADFATLVMYQDDSGLHLFTEASFGIFLEGIRNAQEMAEKEAQRLRGMLDEKGPLRSNGPSMS